MVILSLHVDPVSVVVDKLKGHVDLHGSIPDSWLQLMIWRDRNVILTRLYQSVWMVPGRAAGTQWNASREARGFDWIHTVILVIYIILKET